MDSRATGEHFAADVVVSSDRLRALVGAGEDDVTASTDAFEVLEDVVRRRVARRLTTVIDTLGLDRERRSAWLALARRHDLPCVAVAFDTPAAECRARNRARAKRIPPGALTAQLRRWPATRDGLAEEGFDEVLTPQAVRVVPCWRAGPRWATSRPAPNGSGSGRSSAGSRTATSPTSARSSRRWTCSSGGRAVCGVGLAWHEQEHTAYGWPFPTTAARYALLEDALQLLPLLWGPGSPPFSGQLLDVPEALCYPRPLQDHVPVLVGGAGERRTLRLAARYADVANVFGSAATVRHKTEVLRAHCRDAGRDPDEVSMTHLSTTMVGEDDAHVRALVEARRPRRRSVEQYAATVNAGTVADQVGRFRELAEAGAVEVMVRLPDLGDPASLERMARVIAALR